VSNNVAGAQALSSDLDLNYGGGGYAAPQAAARPAYAAPAAPQHPANGGGAYGGQQGYGSQYGVSLIDQVPQQAPAYPTYYQQTAAAPPQPAAPQVR
jgi:hypothetical protein